MSDRILSAHEKSKQAFELMLSGRSYEEIAKRLGYKGKSGAHKAVMRYEAGLIASDSRTPKEDLQLQLRRLDAMLQGVWTKARRGDIAAVNTVLKLEERRTYLKQLIQGQSTHEDDGDDDEGTPEEVTPLELARRRRREHAAKSAGRS